MMGKDMIEERMEEVRIPALSHWMVHTEIIAQSSDVARLVVHDHMCCSCFRENRSIGNGLVLIYTAAILPTRPVPSVRK